jgi:hypothetical protein
MFVGKYVDEGEPDRPAPPIGSCHASIWSRRCRKSLADRGFRRGGDGAQVVTLGAGHQLGDGEHPGSAGVWFFPGLGRGLAQQGQEADWERGVGNPGRSRAARPGLPTRRRRPGRSRAAHRPRRRCRRGDRQVSVASVWRWSWTPRWAVDVHKNVHRNVHSWNFFKSFCPAPRRPGRSRAAKPRRPTCRRCPLRARGVTPDHNGSGWPGTGRPGCPILCLATRSLPAGRAPAGQRRRGTDRCKCVYPCGRLSLRGLRLRFDLVGGAVRIQFARRERVPRMTTSHTPERRYSPPVA